MSDENAGVMMVRGGASELYLIPRHALGQFRASDEQRAAMAAAVGEDVSGFFTPVPIPRIAGPQPELRADIANLAVVQFVLPRTLVEARPAIGPRPGV
jgi:hypothetical protein